MFGILWQAIKDIFSNNVAQTVAAIQPPENVIPIQSAPSCGIQLIQQLEGYRDIAYRDGGGVLTIGYGHTKNVKQGNTCTQQQATAWLMQDSYGALQAIKRLVKVPLSQNQEGSLLSWTYNVGEGELAKSTLLKELNARNYGNVPTEMKKFCWITVNGNRVFSQGLANRRKAEIALWIGSDWRQVS